MEAARLSSFSCPYGWSTSAGWSARLTERKAITEAARSTIEWIASLRIATAPVIAAAASFRAISVELEAIETAAAAGLLTPVRCATGFNDSPPRRGARPAPGRRALDG